MSRDFKFKFAVGEAEGASSQPWRLWSHQNEVYATHPSRGGIEKISFHTPTICRRAFVKEYSLPDHLEGRLIHEWHRLPTPAAGNKQAVKVLTVLVPSAHLSICAKKEPGTRYFPSTGSSAAMLVQLMFTADRVEEFEDAIEGSGRNLEAYHSLPNGESIAVTSHSIPWSNESMIMVSTGMATKDLVLPGIPTPGVNRPAFLTLYVQTDELVCIEMSGFKMAQGVARMIYPDAGTFTQQNIIDKVGNVWL